MPLTSLSGDIAALGRALERLDGPVILAGHAYAGAVIAETRDPKVASLVYIAGLAPEEGETVADIFYRAQPHPKAPETKPDPHGLVWLPEQAFADAFAPNASPDEQAILAAVQRPISVACISVPAERPLWKDGPSWVLIAEQDRMINPQTQHFQADGHRTRRRPRHHPRRCTGCGGDHVAPGQNLSANPTATGAAGIWRPPGIKLIRKRAMP